MIEHSKKYKSIFISDVHLGSRVCQADLLCEFLKNNNCETLYVVGDLIDFWKISNGKPYWPQSHSNVLRRILTLSKRDSKINYVIGNHDEYFRKWLKTEDSIFSFGNIEISNNFEHTTVCGKKLLVTHGDLFDNVMRNHRWLSLLGDKAYSFLIFLNLTINKFRKILGKEPWSFSNFVKVNTKKAVSFISNFEDCLIEYAHNKGYDGVICGHIHFPKIAKNGDLVYLNTGDWCETISAIVENYDGSLDLVVFDANTGKMKKISYWRENEITHC